MLDWPGRAGRWAIEIKRTLSAKPGKGFYQACEDIQPDKSFVVYAGTERYPVSEEVHAIGVLDMTEMLLGMG